MLDKEELKKLDWDFYFTGKEYVAEHKRRKRKCVSLSQYSLIRMVNETYKEVQ